MENPILTPGTFLHHNTYRIERVLGHGGFGITYLATDVIIEKLVAIKEFFPKDYCWRESDSQSITVGVESNTDFVLKLKEKFLKEARRLAQLNHPNIIKIYSAFEENDTAYYVMEYIDGPSLEQMVKEQGKLPVGQAVKYIEEIGDALNYLHENHINHLDIKPGNIMINRHNDQAILIDFGISKQYDAYDRQTTTTPVGISHGYAPVEQYMAEGVETFSPETDIYSLGATLFYAITGNVPPQAVQLTQDTLRFPPGLPTNITSAITKAMNPRRTERYHSVKEFLAALKRRPTAPNNASQIAEGPSSTSAETKIHQPAAYQEIQEKKKNNKAMIFALVGFVVIVIVGLTFYLLTRSEDYEASYYYDTAVSETAMMDTTMVLDDTTGEDAVEVVEVEETPAPEVEEDEDEYIDEFNGAEAQEKNGQTCYFFSGNFYDDDGNAYPVNVAFIEKNGRISSAVYQNMYNNANIQVRMSISQSGDNYYLSGTAGGSPFTMDLDANGYGFSGIAYGKSSTLSVALSPTTRSFTFKK